MNSKGLNNTRGSFLLMNTMFGGGVIFIPNGSQNMGYLGGLIFLALATFVTLLTLIFLCMSVEKANLFTFSGLSNKMGKSYATFLNLSVALLCYGSTLGYFLTLVKNIGNLSGKSGYLSRIVISLILSFLLFFLAKQKSLEKLSFSAMLTVFATFFVGLSLFVWSFISRTNEGLKAVPFNNEVLKGYPTLLFALGCQQNGVSIYASLKNRNLKNGIKTMTLGCVFAFIIYTIIGFFGYLTFGSSLNANSGGNFLEIISNSDSVFIKQIKSKTFDKFGAIPMLVNIAFLLVLVCAFPLQTFAGRQALQNLISDSDLSDRNIIYITILQMVAVSLFAIFGISAGAVINFIGSTACPIISFAYPSLIFIHFSKSKTALYYTAWLVAIFSAVLMVSGLYEQIRKFI